MENRKYELTNDTVEFDGVTLYRIRALRDSGGTNAFKKGDLGGYIEREHNLSHEGDSWVSDNAIVLDNARVQEDGYVSFEAVVRDGSTVRHSASVGGSVRISEGATITGLARVTGEAKVTGDVTISGRCFVYGNAEIKGNSGVIKGEAKIGFDAQITENQVFTVTGLDGGNDTFTAYRLSNGGIGCTHKLFEGTLEEFIAKVARNYQEDETQLEVSRLLIQMAKLKLS